MRLPQPVLLTVLLALLVGCPDDSTPVTKPTEGAKVDPALAELAQRARTLFGVVPKVAEHKTLDVTGDQVALGRMLYFDARLSRNQQLSCNSCHDLARFGVDGEPTSPGHRGQRGERNSPTVYNSALQTQGQFWDWRAADVEAQAQLPITNPIEMAMADAAAVEALLKTIPGYERPFKDAFPDDANPVTMANVGRAIGAYERRLMTPSRFDEFMGGKVDALNEQEVRGLEAFIEVGCVACHLSPLLGGNMPQKMGLLKPYPGLTDPGRFKVTSAESDRFMFKVPQLRNVTRTGPYLHDGSVASLQRVVELMAEYQLGKTLPPEQVGDLLAFLGALEGTPPADLITAPPLPPSGPTTPAADPN